VELLLGATPQARALLSRTWAAEGAPDAADTISIVQSVGVCIYIWAAQGAQETGSVQ